MPATQQPWLTREILLAFWKVHILHHAAREPIIGQWIMRELRHHGYDVSGGTLYPLLARMEERGWLRSRVDPGGALRARRKYTLTRAGHKVLEVIRRQIEELHREVVLGKERQ
jgi:PadR family transcriptional regulator PadR